MKLSSLSHLGYFMINKYTKFSGKKLKQAHKFSMKIEAVKSMMFKVALELHRISCVS